MINYKKLFYLDIETVCEYKSWSEFVINNKLGSDSFKLKYDRAQKNDNKQWHGTIEDVYRNNAPLLAEYGKIVCISYGFFEGEVFKISSKTIKDFILSEKELIEFIKKIFDRTEVKNLTLCGHNIKGFDIPFIFKKMLKYSIKIPNCINILDKKPWEIRIFDTAESTKGTGFVATSLADLTYMLDLESPKDDINGSQVHDIYYVNDDILRISKYCEKDVVAVKDICIRLFDCFGETF